MNFTIDLAHLLSSRCVLRFLTVRLMKTSSQKPEKIRLLKCKKMGPESKSKEAYWSKVLVNRQFEVTFKLKQDLTRRSVWIFASRTLLRWSYHLFHWGPTFCSQLCKSYYYRMLVMLLRTAVVYVCQSWWPCGLRRGSAAARFLGLWVGMPPVAWTCVSCEWCVL